MANTTVLRKEKRKEKTGFLLRLPSCAPSTQYSSWILFFFLVSFPWFWVSLSSFLLLSPLLEPSLFFFFVVCQVPAGGRSCNTTKKKKLSKGLCVKLLCDSRAVLHAQAHQGVPRGSNPHSRMTHHKGVVSLTPNIHPFQHCHFCRGLSISLPCCK